MPFGVHFRPQTSLDCSDPSTLGTKRQDFPRSHPRSCFVNIPPWCWKFWYLSMRLNCEDQVRRGMKSCHSLRTFSESCANTFWYPPDKQLHGRFPTRHPTLIGILPKSCWVGSSGEWFHRQDAPCTLSIELTARCHSQITRWFWDMTFDGTFKGLSAEWSQLVKQLLAVVGAACGQERAKRI